MLPLIRKEIRLCEASKVCPHSERSLKRWVKAYRDGGPSALIAKSTQPKTQPNETSIRIKEAIIALRKQIGLCAMTGIVAIHIHSLTDFNLHIPSNAAYFAILIGILAAIGRSDEAKINKSEDISDLLIEANLTKPKRRKKLREK